VEQNSWASSAKHHNRAAGDTRSDWWIKRAFYLHRPAASLNPGADFELICASHSEIGDARMGDERAQRLDDALSSLVDTLIPTLPNEDEATADERHDDALDLARSFLEGYMAMSG